MTDPASRQTKNIPLLVAQNRRCGTPPVTARSPHPVEPGSNPGRRQAGLVCTLVYEPRNVDTGTFSASDPSARSTGGHRSAASRRRIRNGCLRSATPMPCRVQARINDQSKIVVGTWRCVRRNVPPTIGSRMPRTTSRRRAASSSRPCRRQQGRPCRCCLRPWVRIVLRPRSRWPGMRA